MGVSQLLKNWGRKESQGRKNNYIGSSLSAFCRKPQGCCEEHWCRLISVERRKLAKSLLKTTRGLEALNFDIQQRALKPTTNRAFPIQGFMPSHLQILLQSKTGRFCKVYHLRLKLE
ncbi:hypothetical protein SOVF_123550 [Spinacia oleracea]|nr:hypothetical protein SOVF_123550 [Spinacia oleracea]